MEENVTECRCLIHEMLRKAEAKNIGMLRNCLHTDLGTCIS